MRSITCIILLTLFCGASMRESVQQEKVYYFEPDTSFVTGILKQEVYFGPPNYGENPKTDSKEKQYVFYPNKPISVLSKPNTKQDSYNTTTKNIKSFQLVNTRNISLSKYINKKIKISGTFFGAHTAHHHTKILLDIVKIELL